MEEEEEEEEEEGHSSAPPPVRNHLRHSVSIRADGGYEGRVFVRMENGKLVELKLQHKTYCEGLESEH
ncbi:hypothetical protein MHYP_G00129990 [Metynnis hypsauchen]